MVALTLPIVPLVLGLTWGLGRLNGINYDRGAWRQTGVLHEVPARALVDLQRAGLDLASLHGTGKGEANIDVVLTLEQSESLKPMLRWALRAYPNLRLVPSVPLAAAPIVIAPPGDQPRLRSRYSGTEIAVLQRWQPSTLSDFYSRMRWALYREAMQPGEVSNVILWTRRLDLPAESRGGGPVEATEPQRGAMEQ
jgi:hypothetical protein